VHVVVALVSLTVSIPIPLPLALHSLLPVLLVQLHSAVRGGRGRLAHHHGHAGGTASASRLCGRGTALLRDHLAAPQLLQVLNQVNGGHAL